MSFKSELKELLGIDGKWSTKRVLTFSAFGLVALAFILNLFCDIKIEEYMYDGMIAIVWAGLGVVVGEHLLKKKNGENPSKIQNESDDEPESELGDN